MTDVTRLPDGSESRQTSVAAVAAGGLGTGTVKRATLSVGTSVVSAALATVPVGGSWRYLKIMNLHATAVLSIAINENPTASAADPPAAGQWGVGYDIPGGGAELIPLSGTITTIRLLSDTVATPVVLNLVA